MNDVDLPFAIGDVIAGKHRIEKVLGVGGMGAVFSARHTLLDELCAIKVLLPEAARRKGFVERFLQEAKVAVKLKSEHAINVHDVGQLDDGTPFMVMEYLEGRDLGVVLKEEGAAACE